jgi:arsenite methyltransferase
MTEITITPVDTESLRDAIRAEYAAVADHPDQGFHFHTGAHLAAILGYPEEWIAALPASAVESMAGTGNPFALGDLQPDERVVDCGSGSGVDSLIAARLVGPEGWVIGVDMTPEMLAKARQNAGVADLRNVEFREGVLEAMPVPDDWADVVIAHAVRDHPFEHHAGRPDDRRSPGTREVRSRGACPILGRQDQARGRQLGVVADHRVGGGDDLADPIVRYR